MATDIIPKLNYFQVIIDNSWLEIREQHICWLYELEAGESCPKNMTYEENEGYIRLASSYLCDIIRRLLSFSETKDVKHLFVATYRVYNHLEIDGLPAIRDLDQSRKSIWMMYQEKLRAGKSNERSIQHAEEHAIDYFEHHLAIMIVKFLETRGKVISYDGLLHEMGHFEAEMREPSSPDRNSSHNSKTRSLKAREHSSSITSHSNQPTAQQSKIQNYPTENESRSSEPGLSGLQDYATFAVETSESDREWENRWLTINMIPDYEKQLSDGIGLGLRHLGEQGLGSAKAFLRVRGVKFAPFFKFDNEEGPIKRAPFCRKRSEYCQFSGHLPGRQNTRRDDRWRAELWRSTQHPGFSHVNQEPVPVSRPNMRNLMNSAFLTPGRAAALPPDFF